MNGLPFGFSQPWWLLGLLAILPVAAWLRRRIADGESARIARYADPHLLPYLTGSLASQPRRDWRRFRGWALLWSMLILAMAGPRWDYEQIQLSTPGADLVILLDLSGSMEVADVPPSRLARARQEIEDLITRNPGARIGLIAFASVAHVITPVTADGNAIRRLLPALSTDLVQLRGSRLGPALQSAQRLLAAQPEQSRHSILLISDGDFADPDPVALVAPLAAAGIRLHALGVGTPGGGPVVDREGRFLTDAGRKAIESRLDVDGLKRLAEAGGGLYLQADYHDDDSRAILAEVLADSEAAAADAGRIRVWKERFHWLLLPALLALLPGFRRYRSGGGR